MFIVLKPFLTVNGGAFRLCLFAWRMGLLMFIVNAHEAFGQDVSQSDNVNYCVDEQAVIERNQRYSERLFKRIKKFRADKIPSKSVIIDVSQYVNSLRGMASMAMNVDVLKTKSYLKYERLLLVGDGFDDEMLMRKAANLEGLGFRDVKVLGGGRLAQALLNKEALTSSEKEKQLRVQKNISPETALSHAVSSSIEGEYVFVLPKHAKNMWDGLEVGRYFLDGDGGEGDQEQIHQILRNTISQNKYAKIVFAVDENEVMLLNLIKRKAVEYRHVWLVEGGFSGLQRARINSLIKPVKKRNHKLACQPV